jgi:hypothetical protein
MTGEDHLDAAPMLEYFQPLYLAQTAKRFE